MRSMYPFYTFITMIFLSFLISACGGEDAFDGGCNPANTATVISSVSVVGSFTDTGPIEVIDESADFTVSWDLNSSCTYTYQLYLAATSAPTNLDIAINSGTCGFGQSCGYDNDVTCSFDATLKTITCGAGSAVNVSSLLPDPSPSNRYFILRASNEMMDSANSTSAQVRFDY